MNEMVAQKQLSSVPEDFDFPTGFSKMEKAEGLDLPNVPLHMDGLIGNANNSVKSALVQLQAKRGEIEMEANTIINEANKEMKNALSDKLMPEIVREVMVTNVLMVIRWCL